MAVSAFCRKAENAASAFTSRHHPCASEQFGAVQFAWLDKAADPHCFCPIRRVLVLEGSSPRQTLSGMGLAEAKLFRAC